MSPERFENSNKEAEELKGLRSKFYRDTTLYNQLVEFSQGLRSKYPDAEDYELFHFLICSTLQRPCSKYDFEGNDSVVKFLEKENLVK